MIDKDPFQAGIKIILDTVKTLPLKPGVYRMLDTNGQVLYIGKAKNLKNRVRSYTMIDQLPIRLKRMVFSTAAMEIISTKTEVEAVHPFEPVTVTVYVLGVETVFVAVITALLQLYDEPPLAVNITDGLVQFRVAEEGEIVAEGAVVF